MNYCEIKPRYPLSRFVECFWTLESDAPATNTERILPDGCVELILNFGAEFSQHCEGRQQLQPRNFLVGQMTGPILISPTGAVQLIGIRFHPGGTLPFLRLPLYEITDQVVELGGLSSRLERDLVHASSISDCLAEKVIAVLRNENVAQRITATARLNLKEFTVQNMLKEHSQLYENTLAGI